MILKVTVCFAIYLLKVVNIKFLSFANLQSQFYVPETPFLPYTITISTEYNKNNNKISTGYSKITSKL